MFYIQMIKSHLLYNKLHHFIDWTLKRYISNEDWNNANEFANNCKQDPVLNNLAYACVVVNTLTTTLIVQI